MPMRTSVCVMVSPWTPRGATQLSVMAASKVMPVVPTMKAPEKSRFSPCTVAVRAQLTPTWKPRAPPTSTKKPASLTRRSLPMCQSTCSSAASLNACVEKPNVAETWSASMPVHFLMASRWPSMGMAATSVTPSVTVTGMPAVLKWNAEGNDATARAPPVKVGSHDATPTDCVGRICVRRKASEMPTPRPKCQSLSTCCTRNSAPSVSLKRNTASLPVALSVTGSDEMYSCAASSGDVSMGENSFATWSEVAVAAPQSVVAASCTEKVSAVMALSSMSKPLPEEAGMSSVMANDAFFSCTVADTTPLMPSACE
mmetsp:Transcript_60011/g.142001  ORF Transcript_60011/g.142001 Transcript_60011/m.142001 type:complete len:313 (-) Transcript_60011:18-956(-)